MTDMISQAKAAIFNASDITDLQLERLLGNILGNAIDTADLYFQTSWSESWALEDGIIKDGSYNVDRGVGVRAISNEKVGFAYSDDIIMPALQQAAGAAKSIATLGGNSTIKAWNKQEIASSLYIADNPLQSITDAAKIALLHQADTIARKQDPRVKQVLASLSASYNVVFIVATDGTYAADIRPLVRMNVTVIVEQNGRTEQASCGGGGRFSYDMLIKNNAVAAYTLSAVRQALLLLEAKPAPAGLMPVVLGPGWPGVLLHEAIGHGLEGDFNRKGSSAFAGRLGEKVASDLCTVVDDGTLAHRRGSLNIDDEGTKTQCTTLIANGVLTGYMQDKLNAKLMKQAPTGNGRRESYASPTIPRMTNTYMLPGKHAAEEIIASVARGIYAVNFSGGQVDITSGKFVFNASEAYLIDKGKIVHPVKGATLIGDGPDILSRVSMVGNDLQLDTGVGVCGKDGQNVPVGVGQPTLLIDAMTVGGTK